VKIEENWLRLYLLVESYCPNYIPIMDGLKKDSIVKLKASQGEVLISNTYLGFMRAPAAKRNHHAYEGGLVAHLLEMWDFWETISCGHPFGEDAGLTKSRVLRGVLNHDLHKALLYYRLKPSSVWSVERQEHAYTGFMADNAQTMLILMKYGIHLDELDMNCLMWSEGGWALDQPRERTALATLVYCLDELSGNVKARIDEGTALGMLRDKVE